MEERKEQQERREEQKRERGIDRPDIQPAGSEPEDQTPHGVTAGDTSTSRTLDEGEQADTLPKDDSGIIDTSGTATTPAHGLPVKGGKLAGNKDDFEGELNEVTRTEESNQGLSNDEDQETGNRRAS